MNEFWGKLNDRSEDTCLEYGVDVEAWLLHGLLTDILPVSYLSLSLRVSSQSAGLSFAVETRNTQFSKQSSIILVNTRTCSLNYCDQWRCLIDLFFVNSKLDVRRRSGIQSKFLDGGTSSKVPKAGRTTRNDWQENKGKEGGEDRNRWLCLQGSIKETPSSKHYEQNFIKFVQSMLQAGIENIKGWPRNAKDWPWW